MLQKTGKQPDFKMVVKAEAGKKDAVWIDDRRTPLWAKRNLDKLPGGVGLPPPTLPPFIPAEALQGTRKEPYWVQVFTNYKDFWDNRENVRACGLAASVHSELSSTLHAGLAMATTHVLTVHSPARHKLVFVSDTKVHWP